MSDALDSYGALARWYDAIYDARGKDYAAEAQELLGLARQHGGAVRSVLDVACGTGRHLAAFGAEGVAELAGVDASADMLAVARQRLGSAAVLTQGDLRGFDLDRRFDVVTCLFSSIGHVADDSELDAAVAAMARHVAPGGVLLLQPWLTPDTVRPGGVRDLVCATTDDGVVARAARSHLEGDTTILAFAWAIATEDGVQTVEERLRMPVFSQWRYLAAVERAGLTPRWLEAPGRWAGRGLVIGSSAPGNAHPGSSADGRSEP
jgi:SAM-dependent methyltransferase